MERIRKKQAETKARNELRQQNKLIELAERAKQGDPLARMKTAEPNSYEYWEAYRDYELEARAEYTNPRIRYVNDISIFDDDFVEKVLLSIAEQGVILTQLLTV